MSNIENSNDQGREGELPGQQFSGEQVTALQQLLRYQSDIEGQGQRVTHRAQIGIRRSLGFPREKLLVLAYKGANLLDGILFWRRHGSFLSQNNVVTSLRSHCFRTSHVSARG